ncbi:MAG: hypothetical protein BWX99_02960 [Deltaproteobacteria bacterium ADurb.Bin151]|nr:MAG: hypothetical protein BWX99_02960 [Deltaproteobacteria bacterium ADurb.Bin151]
MRKKIVVLKNITQTALLRLYIDTPQRIEPDVIAKAQTALVRFFKPGKHADDCRLSAAGWTNQHHHLSASTFKGNVHIKVPELFSERGGYCHARGPSLSLLINNKKA